MKAPVFLSLALLATALAESQTMAAPAGFAIEVSLENSSLPRLPMYRNAITSLIVEGDYAIAGTSASNGLSPYVFAASLSRREVLTICPLEEAVRGQRSIPGGFARGGDGSLYAGTVPQSTSGSGHLIRIVVRGRELAITDLGIPAPAEGVLTVAADPKRQMIYGLTYPSGRFFSFHLPDRKPTLYNETAPDQTALKTLSEYVLKPDEYLSRRLVVDGSGRVFGSLPLGGIFRFDPNTRKLQIWKDALPSLSGHRALARADAWALAPDGTLYGGNAADGQLFTLNPVTGRVVNLGKPAMTPRIEGLAFASDGVLYGVTGGRPGYVHLFSYDPHHGFRDFGAPVAIMKAPGIDGGIPWIGYQIATVAASADRRSLVLGEDEALSQLLVISVERLRSDRGSTF